MKVSKLTEEADNPEIVEDPESALLARIQGLENERKDLLMQSERRIILAELKVEAIRSGMIDMDET